jgi:hypothetical protein
MSREELYQTGDSPLTVAGAAVALNRVPFQSPLGEPSWRTQGQLPRVRKLRAPSNRPVSVPFRARRLLAHRHVCHCGWFEL